MGHPLVDIKNCWTSTSHLWLRGVQLSELMDFCNSLHHAASSRRSHPTPQPPATRESACTGHGIQIDPLAVGEEALPRDVRIQQGAAMHRVPQMMTMRRVPRESPGDETLLPRFNTRTREPQAASRGGRAAHRTQVVEGHRCLGVRANKEHSKRAPPCSSKVSDKALLMWANPFLFHLGLRLSCVEATIFCGFFRDPPKKPPTSAKTPPPTSAQTRPKLRHPRPAPRGTRSW